MSVLRFGNRRPQELKLANMDREKLKESLHILIYINEKDKHSIPSQPG
mgnify:CR=1 FL=1